MKRYREDTKKRLHCTFLLFLFRITAGLCLTASYSRATVRLLEVAIHMLTDARWAYYFATVSKRGC